MTLAALAYVAPIPGDAVHTVEEEEQYMLAGLTLAFADTRLPTQGEWTVVWIGLNDNQGNFSYIARHASEDTIAVAVRGTIFAPALGAAADVYEDLRVGVVDDFIVGDETVKISHGASTALDAVTGAQFTVPGHALSDMRLLEAVKALVGDGARSIYVTGHSLGGCVATMLGLSIQELFAEVSCHVFTFAAPTAGLQAFADLFDCTFGPGQSGNSACRLVNRCDAVPHGWQSLSDLAGWYPSPGPAQSAEVIGALLGLTLLPGSNKYVQPSVNVVTLNTEPYGGQGSLWDPRSESATLDGFKGQVLFQHSVVLAYMPLLGAALQGLTSATIAEPAEALAAGAPASVALVEPGFVHTLAVQAT